MRLIPKLTSDKWSVAIHGLWSNRLRRVAVSPVHGVTLPFEKVVAQLDPISYEGTFAYQREWPEHCKHDTVRVHK